jgi:CRP-like cAMP-binding protein
MAVRQNAPVTDPLLAAAADLPLQTIPAGEVFIEEGTDPGRLLVLVSGEVTVERDGVPFARIDRPGAIFGEMAAVLHQPATASARASTEVVVHVVDDPEAFLTERPGAALAVLRVTATRLDRMTQYLVDVKAQFAEEEGHLGMVGSILDTLVNHQGAPARTGSARDPEGDHVH